MKNTLSYRNLVAPKFGGQNQTQKVEKIFQEENIGFSENLPNHFQQYFHDSLVNQTSINSEEKVKITQCFSELSYEVE